MTTGVGILSGRFGRIALLDMDTSLVVHAHAHCHVVLKVDGPDQTFCVDGRAVPLRNDTAVLVNSWQEHNYPHRPDGRRTLFLALYLEPAWLADTDPLFRACGGPGFFEQPCAVVTPRARRLGLRLVERLQVLPQVAGDELEPDIHDLVAALGHRHAARAPLMARRIDFRIRRALCEIDRMRSEPVDFGDMAAVAGLSRSRFNTLFRASTGVTPAVYGNAIRIEASVAALAHASVSTVADELGFSAASNFCRFFQSHTGVAPGEYRRVMAYL